MRFHHFSYNMGLRDVLLWWSRSCVNQPVIADYSSLIAGENADQLHEPFEHAQKSAPFDFHRASIRPDMCRTHSSLLTKAIHSDHAFENSMKSVASVNTPRSVRPRSIISTASLELTSDAGTMSTSHSQMSSPSQHQQDYSLINFGIDDQSLTKFHHPTDSQKQIRNVKLAENHLRVNKNIPFQNPDSLDSSGELPSSIKTRPATPVCNAYKTTGTRSRSRSEPESNLHPRCNPPLQESCMTSDDAAKVLPRKPTIKFACHGPPPSRAPVEPNLKGSSLSPNSRFPRDSHLLTNVPSITSVESIEIAKQTPSNHAVQPLQLQYKNREIKEIPGKSQATRFHEFASGEMEIDDWVHHDLSDLKQKLTIKDTLKKENEFRRLANEAEAEELEEEEAVETSNDEEEKEYEDDEDDSEDNLEDSEGSDLIDSENSDLSGHYWNHGNETFNEAGFANSDGSEDDRYPAPRTQANKMIPEFSAPTRRRFPFNSSIDSLPHLRAALSHRRLPGKTDPAHSELPDSTDFVCGTLDEDRPLEEAYLSCIEARKQARYKSTPQDIDPSFPASDSDVEKDKDFAINDSSDKHEYPHSDRLDDGNGGRKFRTLSRNQAYIGYRSPKKLHSPPPRKQRLRLPSSRKSCSNSPGRNQISIPNSKSSYEEVSSISRPITFSTLGTRPGPTYTKSLPRTSNHFYREYHTDCLGTLSDCENEDEKPDNHVRGAIDIVKGLEHKRQRRKENFDTKQSTRRVKGRTERKTQPGKGAERMREVGLFMAGKSGTRKPYIISA